MPLPGVTTARLAARYDVVVVGAGIQGVALGYELAKRGAGRIAVVDAAWPGAGASGRNGEMIRSAFASPEWCGLFQESLRRWHGLSAELDFNTLFTPAGYMVAASSEEELERLRGTQPLHRAQGIGTELLDAAQARGLLPAASPEVVRGGLFQPDGGFAHHDAVLWGFARAAARHGAEIRAFTPLEAIETRGGRVVGVTLAGQRVETPVVVNAAGAFAKEVAAMAGAELPTQRLLLEMLVTESLQPFLRPAVASPALLSYCHQTSRGEFVGGTEWKATHPSDDMVVTLAGLRDAATKFVRLFPLLAGVRVVRHWSGLVDQTPDLSPVIGPAPDVEGFFFDCGWIYGFMGAPGTAPLIAEAILDGRVPAPIAPFGVERLHRGELIAEGSLVVPSEETTEVGA